MAYKMNELPNADNIDVILDVLSRLRSRDAAARALRPEALQALKGYIQADADGVMVYVSRQALDEAIAALDVAQPSAAPLRMCGMCQTWNSKPCGEQCGYLPTDPTYEQMAFSDAAHAAAPADGTVIPSTDGGPAA